MYMISYIPAWNGGSSDKYLYTHTHSYLCSESWMGSGVAFTVHVYFHDIVLAVSVCGGGFLLFR